MPSTGSQGEAGGDPSQSRDGSQPGIDPAADDGGPDPSGDGPGGMPGTADGMPASGGGLPGSSGGGDYTLDTLPGGGVFQGSAGTGQPGGDGGMTAAQRAAILDEQLRRTYEVYDEVLQREQAEARGIEIPGGNSGGASLPGGGGSQQPGGANQGGASGGSASGEGNGRSEFPASPGGGGNEQETYAPPEDIPSGRDDDVVARQLREAAMTEPDPVLREALWDEYRNYTGIATDR